MSNTALIRRVVLDVQTMPYRWPAPPSALSARTDGAGTCASKHALLAEELYKIGVPSRPIFCIGPLVPPLRASFGNLRHAADLVEVHELLTVDLPDMGPARIDVTWDPPLLRAGLAGTLDWDGMSDMIPAVGPVTEWHAPDPERLRESKEKLRKRIYSGDERRRRNAALAEISDALGQLRTTQPSGRATPHHTA